MTTTKRYGYSEESNTIKIINYTVTRRFLFTQLYTAVHAVRKNIDLWPSLTQGLITHSFTQQ